MSIPHTQNPAVEEQERSQDSDKPDQPNYAHCCICFDDKPMKKGLTCSNGHFLCDECLGEYLTSRVRNISITRTDGLNLPCPEPDCDPPSFLPPSAIATHLPRAARGGIFRHVHNAITTMNRQEQPPDNVVQPNPQANPQDDIRRCRNHVVDEILTLRRPCECRRAFDDFNGCCAVTCDICPAGRGVFCGLCLALCDNSNQAHEHAREQHGGIFFPDQVIREHHNGLRQGLLFRYFHGLDANIDREALLNALHPNLADLGMNVDEIRAALGLNAPPAAIPPQPLFQPPEPLPVARRLSPVAVRTFMRRHRCFKSILIIVLFLIILALAITIGVLFAKRSHEAPSTPTAIPSATITSTPSNSFPTSSPTSATSHNKHLALSVISTILFVGCVVLCCRCCC
jgi:hypothetical protein